MSNALSVVVLFRCAGQRHDGDVCCTTRGVLIALQRPLIIRIVGAQNWIQPGVQKNPKELTDPKITRNKRSRGWTWCPRAYVKHYYVGFRSLMRGFDTNFPRRNLMCASSGNIPSSLTKYNGAVFAIYEIGLMRNLANTIPVKQFKIKNRGNAKSAFIQIPTEYRIIITAKHQSCRV